MLMMRLKTENSVCWLLQVFIMHPKKYHYAKENVHQVLNQTDLQLKTTSFGCYLMFDFTNVFL